MNLRGLEMLLALTGCMLFFGLFTGNLTFADILWAGGGIAAVLAITGGVIRSLFPYLKETKRWERFTEKVGKSLTLHSRGGIHRPSLSGRVADCHVAISPVDREHLIVVSVPSSIVSHENHEISLELKTDLNADQPTIALGDPEFDSQVVLRGTIPETIAVLDAETRAITLDLMQDLLVEVRRRQVLKYGRHLELDPDGTWLCLERMAEVADRLFRLGPRQAKKKLADNAERDPNPKVRALNLRYLFEYYPPDARTLALGRAALETDDVDCALAGAIGLTEAGDELDQIRAFEHLADIAVGDTFSNEIRSAAIDALASHHHERANEILRAIAREEGPLPSALLPALLRSGIDFDLTHQIARAMIATEAAQAELIRRTADQVERFEPLFAALLSSPFDRVQLLIIDLLMTHGTIVSVEALLPLTRGLLRSKIMRDRAQLAVAAIQSRAKNGDEGQLSLARSTRAGELSEL